MSVIIVDEAEKESFNVRRKYLDYAQLKRITYMINI